MIACEFLLFGAFLWLFGALGRVKFASKPEFAGKFLANVNFARLASVKFKYTLTLLVSALCLVPFYKGFGVAGLMYSFFDAPSVLCVLLMGFFVLKTLLKDFAKFELNLSVKPLSFVLLFFYGLVVFLGNSDLIPYDFYVPNAQIQPYLDGLLLHALAQCAFVFVLLLALYAADKLCALLALIALVPFAFGVAQSLLTALICVYLWAFCLVFVLWQGAKFIKGKLCKSRSKA